jgi:hypothetical protein
MNIEKRILELVIIPSQIVSLDAFDTVKDFTTCWECNSNLFYIKIIWGIVAEESDYYIMNYKSKRVYSLREVGFNLYCAKCGSFKEDYRKFFYPSDKLLVFDVLDCCDEDERAEIQNCLAQYNQKGDFKTRYTSNIFTELKKSLIEYDKNHPEKI